MKDEKLRAGNVTACQTLAVFCKATENPATIAYESSNGAGNC